MKTSGESIGKHAGKFCRTSGSFFRYLNKHSQWVFHLAPVSTLKRRSVQLDRKSI